MPTTAHKTEIVDAESLSSGERIVAPDGRIWRVLGEPEEKQGGELVAIAMAVEGDNGPGTTRTVTRTTKYEVICA